MSEFLNIEAEKSSLEVEGQPPCLGEGDHLMRFERDLLMVCVQNMDRCIKRMEYLSSIDFSQRGDEELRRVIRGEIGELAREHLLVFRILRFYTDYCLENRDRFYTLDESMDGIYSTAEVDSEGDLLLRIANEGLGAGDIAMLRGEREKLLKTLSENGKSEVPVVDIDVNGPQLTEIENDEVGAITTFNHIDHASKERVGVTKGANSFQALSDAIEAGGVNGGASDHGGILSPSSRLPTEGGRDIKEMNAPRAPGSGDTRDYTILIVDNDATCVRLLRAVLENSGYSTDTANSGEGALGKVKINRYDCIISDFALEGLRGDELARRVKSMRPIPLILLTGFRPAIKPSELMDFDYVFQKPVNPTELLDVLRSIERAR